MYQAKKAEAFKDTECFIKIMHETNPISIKHLGNTVKNYKEEEWHSKADKIMHTANLAKFSQVASCRKYLLSTGNKHLAEGSPHDKQWGIGIGLQNPNVLHRDKWTGKNKMGRILESVRDSLKQA